MITLNKTLDGYFKDSEINPIKVKPVLFPTKVCVENNGENVDILVYIFTRLDDFTRRIEIRKSWANKKQYPFSEILFVLGISSDTTINELVRMENKKYGDIYQSDFYDTYKNLTYKSITAWRWISNNCMNAKLIVKSDDDIIVNLNSIRYSLGQNNISKANSFSCNVYNQVRPDRTKSSKFYMSYEEYNETFYKMYCEGRGIIFSTDLIPKLNEYSYITKNLWIDDVNVGHIADNIKPEFVNINYKIIPFLNYLNAKNPSTFKDFYFFVDIESKYSMEQIWNKMTLT